MICSNPFTLTSLEKLQIPTKIILELLSVVRLLISGLKQQLKKILNRLQCRHRDLNLIGRRRATIPQNHNLWSKWKIT
jgi:hypothetical protein